MFLRAYDTGVDKRSTNTGNICLPYLLRRQAASEGGHVIAIIEGLTRSAGTKPMR
jgi:hypothetical protein